ncbi:hypothetical protein [Limosilactobacillus fermentum]|uniref:hypothetical protein n=1 Tax=Limosilactobacillus fermentum TaxID=1613 RepID=UPI0021CB4D6D|nr:hypothetical protein [Limosilactobacillus fermentum]
MRGTLNLLQKYEDQFGRSLLQFTIANTKEVVHQIVSSGLTPVMIRRHQDNLIDFCDFCRLHTHCRVKNRSSPKCWCKLNSANLSFHKLKHTGFF